MVDGHDKRGSYMSILNIEHGTFSYNEKNNIFEDINLSVDKGDVVCILGPNGTGKTTLIKCFNNLLKLNEGNIFINDTNIHDLSQREIAKNIAYIPQEHTSTFEFSVFDVVLMGRSPYIDFLDTPSEKDYKITEDTLKKFNIYHMKDKAYTKLSGGEKQLIFFARVYAQQANVLLLDEPTSHLDFGNQIRTLKLIENLSKEGKAVVMTSHFPDHAFLSSNKVAIMKEKRFIDFGSPEDVITEDTMKDIYGIDVKILDLEGRKICIPINLE